MFRSNSAFPRGLSLPTRSLPCAFRLHGLTKVVPNEKNSGQKRRAMCVQRDIVLWICEVLSRGARGGGGWPAHISRTSQNKTCLSFPAEIIISFGLNGSYNQATSRFLVERLPNSQISNFHWFTNIFLSDWDLKLANETCATMASCRNSLQA